MNIKNVTGLEVLDSRGNPTVKAYVELENGITGSATVPSGASTGTYEALELRDTESQRYLGRGVQKCINNINTHISRAIKHRDISDLKGIDSALFELDGTDNKSVLGANAILAVSLASARALAASIHEPLWKAINRTYFPDYSPAFPRILVNIINGGAHANWNFDFQEFMIIPRETAPSESIRIAAEIFQTLRNILKKDGLSISVGDEGGFSPTLPSHDTAFEYIERAIQSAHQNRNHIDLGIDAAASEFYTNSQYNLKKEGQMYSSDELATYYDGLIRKHDLLIMEDIFHEDDMNAFADFTKKHSDRLIVGDDLYVTNTLRIKQGITKSATNAVLIKVNQIGSLSEAVEAIKMTKNAGWKTIISHRSGESEDSFIADLAYACGADFIKTGSMSRSERLAKYNRLLEIEAIEIQKA